MGNRQPFQNSEFADKPGEYRLVVRPSKPEIAPGEDIDLEIYITGYGKIDSPKLSFYPSYSFVLGLVSPELASSVPPTMMTGESGRFWFASFRGGDAFFRDTSTQDGMNMIVSEVGSEGFGIGGEGRPPILLPLQTHRTIRAGVHNLQFFFTYFNGCEWKTDSQLVSVSVPNFFQRHPYVTWAIGIVGVLLALGSFVRTNLDALLWLFKLLITFPTPIGLFCIGVTLILFNADRLPIERP